MQIKEEELLHLHARISNLETIKRNLENLVRHLEGIPAEERLAKNRIKFMVGYLVDAPWYKRVWRTLVKSKPKGNWR